MVTVDGFISDFLKLVPHPTHQQANWLAMSLGIDNNVVQARFKVCALTDTERVLNNDYDPSSVRIDTLLVNDGDPREDKYDPIRDDGELATPTLEQFENFYHYDNGVRDAGD